MNERAVLFGCEGERLVGVISVPDTTSEVAVLIIVGGPQYRVGSHRQYVHLARHLGAAGVPAMRFDARGMGDATGAQLTFEHIGPDIAAALDALQAALPGVRRVALWGLCGGASAALLYWRRTQDPRVHGMVLVNPWVRTELTLARTRVKHYYLQRLLQREFWVKLATGRVAVHAVGELLRTLRTASAAPVPGAAQTQDAALTLEQRMGDAWERFSGPKLLILSGNDYTAKEFLETAEVTPLWRANLASPTVTRLDIPGADHTFSQPQARAAVEEATLQWVVATTREAGPPVRT